jgi:4-oxalocrotonate tautomerase
MDKRLSRRGFLKKGAVALGTIAVCDVTAIIGTASGDAFKVSASKGLRENNMPHVIVKLWPGKSEQQKKQLAEAIVEDVVAILKLGEESVSVSIEEIEPQDWTEKVYKPDILNKPRNLYKKPGYNPLK